MISPERQQRVLRLCKGLNKLNTQGRKLISQRKIAEIAGVSRASVGLIKKRGYVIYPKAMTTYAVAVDTGRVLRDVKRCDQCGVVVSIPCRACATRRNPRPYLITDDSEFSYQLTPEQEARRLGVVFLHQISGNFQNGPKI